MDARYQTTLAALTQSALSSAEMAVFMHRAVVLLAETAGTSYAAIWEVSPNCSGAVLRAGAGWDADAVGRATAGTGASSFAGHTLRSMSPVAVVDWSGETRFDQPPLLRDHAIRASLSAVIPGHERPFGIVSVDSAAPRTFSGEAILFLQAVVTALALAIERARMNQALDQRVEERTRAIEERLVAAAQEKAVLEERQRLARDLHDSVTQSLYGVTLHAEATRRLLTAGAVATAVDYLREIHGTAQEALDEMRLLIFELRSPILEQAGLVAALQARLDAVEGRANLKTTLMVEGAVSLPPLVEKALYRIAQETLNNALKHAHAQHVTVHLQQSPTSASLEITDDGVGFDPASAPETGGLGLRGIGERVAQLGGHVSIRSAAGAGTQLRVEITL